MIQQGTWVNQRYCVERLVATGGMGQVYLAQDSHESRQVALKVMHQSLQETATAKDRFNREAKLLASLNHPNTVKLLDFGELPNGLPYLVTEFLNGETLTERLDNEGKLRGDELTRFFRELCSAVQAAHANDLIHRDLKPSNVFILADENLPNQLKVIDFGIAKALEPSTTDPSLTHTGVVVGTPAYVAPEQIWSFGHTDLRSDIYSLGALLFFMMTGRAPFVGSSPQAIINKQLTSTANFSECDPHPWPPALEAIVLKAMERELDDRFATVTDMAEAFELAWGNSAATPSVNHEALTPQNNAVLRFAKPFFGFMLAALTGYLVISSNSLFGIGERGTGIDDTRTLSKVTHEKREHVDAPPLPPADASSKETKARETPASVAVPKPVQDEKAGKPPASNTPKKTAKSAVLAAASTEKPCPRSSTRKEVELGYQCESSTGLLHGPQLSRFESGEKQRLAHWQNGNKHGLETEWYPNGQIKSEYRYTAGKQDGFWQTYHETGAAHGRGQWKNEEKHGDWESLSVDGHYQFKGSYERGAKVGRWRGWHKNGLLKKEGDFKEGLEIGIWKSWHDSGEVKSAGAFVLGKREGSWKFFDEKGALLQELTFVQGELE